MFSRRPRARASSARRRLLQIQIEQQLMASVSELYAFHLRRCDRIVALVLARALPR
jgi:hypothetical protein